MKVNLADAQIGDRYHVANRVPQTYRVERFDKHPRADGTETTLAILKTNCPECDSEFETAHTIFTPQHLTRRCKNCRRLGRVAETVDGVKALYKRGGISKTDAQEKILRLEEPKPKPKTSTPTSYGKDFSKAQKGLRYVVGNVKYKVTAVKHIGNLPEATVSLQFNCLNCRKRRTTTVQAKPVTTPIAKRCDRCQALFQSNRRKTHGPTQPRIR